MREFLAEYQKENIDKVNVGIMTGEYDSDIIEYIVDSCKALEAIPWVTYKGYEYQEYSDKIDESIYIESKIRDSVKSKSKNVRYRFINDSRLAEMILKFHIDFNGETSDPVVRVLIPIPDENGYYLINGKRYMLMYQIVDNSTYVSKKSVVLKTMVKLAIIPEDIRVTYLNGSNNMEEMIDANIFGIEMGKSEDTSSINILLFYFAKYGYEYTMRYFSLDKVCKIKAMEDNPQIRKDTIYIKLNNKLQLEVNHDMFMKHRYVQNMVAMIYDSMDRRVSMDTIEDCNYWVQRLGELYTATVNSQPKKGISSLLFFERMLDDTTKKILKIHPIHLKNTYSIVRWIVQNFSELRKKSNFDINWKRLRRNELVASLLRYEFGTRSNKILSNPTKIEMRNIEDVFKIPADIIVSSLRKSGLLKYDERVNDMDIWDRFRITAKGPNTMGNPMGDKTVYRRGRQKKHKKKSNHISNKYRTIDPSYIGKIEINVCGTSDPGMTMYLTPNCHMNSLYFGDGLDPESGMYDFDKNIYSSGKDVIGPKMDTKENYYNARMNMEEIMSKSSVTITPKRLYINIDMGEEDGK